MKEWCLGFVFSDDRKSVVLLRKSKTMHVGLWNGIGGKLEENESGLGAMKREGLEETNLSIDDWTHVGYLRGGNYNDPWRVFLYTAIGEVSRDKLESDHLAVADQPYQILLKDLHRFRLAPHTGTLIYASLDKIHYPNSGLIQILEID